MHAKTRSDTVQESPSDVQAVVGNPDGVLKISLRKGAAQPRIGAPFMIPVSSAAPGGVLGIVTAVRQTTAGGWTVITRPAALDDAYSQFRVKLKDTTLAQLAGASPSSARQLFKCTGSGPSATFDVDSDFSKLKPQFLLDIGRPEIFFILSGTARLDVAFESRTKATCKYTGSAKIAIPIAGTPVIITVKPAINGSLAGDLGADFSWSPRMAVGIQKGPGVDQSFHAFNKGVVSTPSFRGSAKAMLFLGVSVGVSVAERVGVEGKAGPQVSVGVNASEGSSCLDADASLHADLDAYADVFVKRWSFTIAKGDFGHAQLFHACASSTGRGGGSTQPQPTPNRFTQVVAGGRTTCALRVDGTAACWGANEVGQANPSSGSFTSLTGGAGHFCGLRPDGAATCWGANSYGQASPPAGAFIQISAGTEHTCGLRSSGEIVCWGRDVFGETSPPSETFAHVVAGGYLTCGLHPDGTAACWGDNTHEQADAPSGEFAQISPGPDGYSCGLRPSGTITCWGQDVHGYGWTTPPTGQFSLISNAAYHMCALRTDHTAVCWGTTEWGESSPPPGTFSGITAGAMHSCGLRNDGSVTCWGRNLDGESTPPQ